MGERLEQLLEDLNEKERSLNLHWLFNGAVTTTRLFSDDEIGDSEMVFGEMRPRIRHRLPGINITVGENLGKTQPSNQPKRGSNPRPSATSDGRQADENPHAVEETRHQHRFSINLWAGVLGDRLRAIRATTEIDWGLTGLSLPTQHQDVTSLGVRRKRSNEFNDLTATDIHLTFCIGTENSLSEYFVPQKPEAIQCNQQLRMDVYAIFHQCAGDKETHRLEGGDKVEQTFGVRSAWNDKRRFLLGQLSEPRHFKVNEAEKCPEQREGELRDVQGWPILCSDVTGACICC
ncbi:hypothetical protein ANN_06689 [Periplaneta americana]|uniref:Uncharacterized protein n=1 Tax=Periplaneta americana TaxID=6978 RepID=A0ABQ8TFH1_PERAM|nr:hypothetical protein ANN_06689 [Periplaneta americana]